MDLCFMNLYGPYLYRELFWNNLLKLECFRYPKLIFGGDMNFSLGYSKFWGAKARLDVLTDFFINHLEGLSLVDIVHVVTLPTWSNHRVGPESICKRLDQLLISADLLDDDLHFR